MDDNIRCQEALQSVISHAIRMFPALLQLFEEQPGSL